VLGITRKDAAVPPVNVNSELMNNVTNVSKHTMNKRASSRRTSKTRSNQKKKRRREEGTEEESAIAKHKQQRQATTINQQQEVEREERGKRRLPAPSPCYYLYPHPNLLELEGELCVGLVVRASKFEP